MTLNKLVFSTSNKKKQEEISKVSNIPFMNSIDLPEIDSQDPILVAVHKAKDIYLKTKKDGIIVEDSILIINGEICTDIKFKYNQFITNIHKFIDKPVAFITTMSVVIGDVIYCFQGSLNGTIGLKKEDGYVFDPYIFIETKNGKKSLAQLEKENIKHLYSPRTKAVILLEDFFQHKNRINNLDNIFIFNLNEIKKWKGNYQA